MRTPFESKRYQLSVQRTITTLTRKSTFSSGTQWTFASARGLVVPLVCAALLLALFARYPPIPGVLLSAAALVLVARLALAAVNPKRILLSASLWLLLALLLTMAVREDWLPLR